MNRNIYFILLIAIFLSGCDRKPDPEIIGLRTETAFEAQMDNSDESGNSAQQMQPEMTASDIEETAVSLAVFVCGAVARPGVYYFPEGSRVCDAVEAAGGFAGIADREWLNLAETLRDGQKLKILTLEEAQIQRNAGTVQEPGMDDGELSAAKEDAASGGRVNLNTATREELMTLPGIGEAKAEAVIRYREEHGTFQTVEEIMQISGIKDAIYMKIKDRLTV